MMGCGRGCGKRRGGGRANSMPRLLQCDMPLDSAKIAELRVKHLEMIQAVILRMSNQAGSVKNYCITVTTAVCGFAITLQRPLVALLAILPITTFALLDAQYLRLERCFRALFERVRSEDWETIPTFEIIL